MIASVLLARVIVAVLLFCLPFFLIIVLGGKSENAILLIFPVIAAIPAVILALLLFWPAELLIDRLGLPALKNVVIPLIGGTLIFVFTLLLGIYDDNLAELLRKVGNKPDGVRVTSFWAMLGVGWGIAWRASEWLARTIGLTNG